MGDYYVNDVVRKMYGIPLSQLTPEQRRILREDGKRRAKLIEERQKDVMQNNRKAFDDAEKMNRVLSSIYESCQRAILADVAATQAKVKKAGGEWSYANQSALTRSRGLFEQINNELVKLGKKENEYFRKNLTNIYTDQFLRATYTLGQTQTVKGNFNMLNPRLIEAALDYPWSGAMFSDRLWLDKDRLGRNLRIGLTQSMILGEDMDRIADRIQANIDTSRYNAMRIARTETKRVCYVSQVEAWKAQGVSEVRYMAANGGDSRSCNLCKADNGKKYKLGEEPTLPRHPNCRCWYNPVTPDTFGDNELNELTGSIRGAENYDKWKQEYEVALNPDGSYKPGWKRESWKDGGRVMYTAADGKKYTLQEYKEALKDGILSDGVKRSTAGDLIRQRIEEDKKENQMYRDGISSQIDMQMEEYKKIPSQYADKLAEIEVKKSQCDDIIAVKKSAIEELEREIEKIPDKRAAIYDKLDAKKLTEDEADSLLDELRQERRDLRARKNSVEDEMYQEHFKKEKLEEDIKRIQKEIRDKQADILNTVHKLNTQISDSLKREIDYELDIAYVGDSMDRYDNLELWRSVREAHRACPTFDMDKYKDELVEMAQRMDKEALVVQEKMAKYVEKNSYDLKNTGWYNWSKVEMDMSDNHHEKALKNGLVGSWQTKFHEEGHQIDHIFGKIDDFCDNRSKGFYSCITNMECSVGKEMGEAIEKDILSFINSAITHCNKNGDSYKPLKSLARISGDAKLATIKYLNELTSDRADTVKKCQLGILTDAIGCYTKAGLHPFAHGYWGHRASYCKSVGKNGAVSETWATFCAMRVCGSKEEIEELKRVMPETWKSMSKVYSKIATYLLTNNI